MNSSEQLLCKKLLPYAVFAQRVFLEKSIEGQKSHCVFVELEKTDSVQRGTVAV